MTAAAPVVTGIMNFNLLIWRHKLVTDVDDRRRRRKGRGTIDLGVPL